jgi:hypothetical protein
VAPLHRRRALRAPALDALLNLGIWAVLLLTLRRAGLTAVVAAFFAANAILIGPVSGDLSAWHSWPLLLNLVALALLAGLAWSRAVAGRPLFRDVLLET